jgi:hypothetical protein
VYSRMCLDCIPCSDGADTDDERSHPANRHIQKAYHPFSIVRSHDASVSGPAVTFCSPLHAQLTCPRCALIGGCVYRLIYMARSTATCIVGVGWGGWYVDVGVYRRRCRNIGVIISAVVAIQRKLTGSQRARSIEKCEKSTSSSIGEVFGWGKAGVLRGSLEDNGHCGGRSSKLGSGPDIFSCGTSNSRRSNIEEVREE